MDEPWQVLRLNSPQRESVFLRRELLDAGVSPAQLRWAIARERWRSILPGVVLLGSQSPTRRQQLIGARVFGGSDAVISGAAAARFHGLRGVAGDGPVDLVVPRGRARRDVRWARLRPTRVPDLGVRRGGVLRVASPARAVLDAARWSRSQSVATSLVVEAVQRRLVSVDQLAGYLEELGQRGTLRARIALAEAASGAWSLPEAELLGLLETSRVLPEVWPNPTLVAPSGLPLLTPDAWFDDVGLAVMVHSRAFHEGGEQWDVTVTRDGELTAYGIVVAGVTPSGIRARPRETLERIERTYAAARARPRPTVAATQQHRGGWLRSELAHGR